MSGSPHGAAPPPLVEPLWRRAPNRLVNFIDLMQGYYNLANLLDILSGATQLAFSARNREPLDEDDIRSVLKLCELVLTFSERAGFTASGATAERMKRLIEGAAQTKISHEDYLKFLEDLDSRLHDEAGALLFLQLTKSEADCFRNPRLGWESILDRFPAAVSEVEEARKCFALSRYPAAVFHTLQVVEFGLIELGTFLNTTDPNSGWTAVSRALEKVVKKTREERTPFENVNFPFLEQLNTTVKVLKDAWRNKISHAQGRLVLLPGEFNSQVAEEIIFATRALMRRLAEGLPQRQEGAE